MTLHDEIFPRLLTWQQNFLMLHSLTISAAEADGFWAADPDAKKWHFQFTSSLAGWVAQYKGRTHPLSVQHIEDANRYLFDKWITHGP